MEGDPVRPGSCRRGNADRGRSQPGSHLVASQGLNWTAPRGPLVAGAIMRSSSSRGRHHTHADVPIGAEHCRVAAGVSVRVFWDTQRSRSGVGRAKSVVESVARDEERQGYAVPDHGCRWALLFRAQFEHVGVDGFGNDLDGAVWLLGPCSAGFGPHVGPAFRVEALGRPVQSCLGSGWGRGSRRWQAISAFAAGGRAELPGVSGVRALEATIHAWEDTDGVVAAGEDELQ